MAPESLLYSDVIRLHRQQKRWLGPLPYEGFDAAAGKGTLLAAVEAGQTLGYVLYRLPDTTIAITHLCVSPGARGRGIARMLVEALEQRHPSRRGIRLRCRRDWPAAAVWPHLDFEPRGDMPGRSIEGHLLTQWWRDFRHPNLFTVPAGPRPLAALDTDVLLDLVDQRMEHAESHALVTDLVLDAYQLVITKQVLLDINNHDDERIRNRHWRSADSWPRADGPTRSWQTNVRTLQSRVGEPKHPHDVSDIHHVARAAAAGAGYFVTRDKRLRSRLADAALELLGISIVFPADVPRLAHQASVGQYEFSSVQGTVFHARSVVHDETAKDVDAFINFAAGEKRAAFRSLLQPILAAPEDWKCELFRDDEQRPTALVGYQYRDGTVDVPLLRTTGKWAGTIARQIAFRLREDARSQRATWVRVSDPRLSIAVRTALADEHYFARDEDLVAMSLDYAGITSGAIKTAASAAVSAEFRDVWGIVRSGLESATASEWVAHDLERSCWPLKLFDSALRSVLVPIRPHWAEALFDVGLAEATLFARPTDLGLSREHVYYRAPTQAHQLRAPARIAWYVSRPQSSVRAVSQLAEVVVDRPEVLFRRFEHLGIYGLDDVRECASTTGRAMALRFTNTELLPAPVSLTALRELADDLHCHTPFVRSAWSMPPELFGAMYLRGSE